MRYDFHPEAHLEYRQAATFYEARRPGLGATFTVEIEATIEKILEAPERWRLIEQTGAAVLLTFFLTASFTPSRMNLSLLLLWRTEVASQVTGGTDFHEAPNHQYAKGSNLNIQ